MNCTVVAYVHVHNGSHKSCCLGLVACKTQSITCCLGLACRAQSIACWLQIAIQSSSVSWPFVEIRNQGLISYQTSITTIVNYGDVQLHRSIFISWQWNSAHRTASSTAKENKNLYSTLAVWKLLMPLFHHCATFWLPAVESCIAACMSSVYDILDACCLKALLRHFCAQCAILWKYTAWKLCCDQHSYHHSAKLWWEIMELYYNLT